MINPNSSPGYKEPEAAVLAPETVRAQSHARKHRPLSVAERIELEASMRAGDTQLAVAVRLNRATGTISGEPARNGGREHYRAAAADQASVARRGAARRGRCAIDEHPPLRDEVHAQLPPRLVAGADRGHHLDIKKLGCFVRPGVRATGNRAGRSEGARAESLHVAIDDHSRLGFA